jgi:MFS family permease
MQDAPQKYKNFLLTTLLVVLAFNWIDRTALGLLLQDIKVDLLLSDTQLGFMSGIAFAAFYSVMGVPIARWADRGDRVLIISLTTALCGVAVALCGLARSFTQLLLIRIAVGVGEAGCAPPGHSLIAEHFARAERPRAAAIYSLGAPLSILIGYFLAGWLNQLFGWRLTFILLGLPGFALAAFAWLMLKEPRRHKSSPMLSRPDLRPSPISPNFKQVCITLWSNATFRHLLVGFSVSNFFVYGISQWQPAFFMRSFGFHTGSLGTWLALISGFVGLLGTYAGGRWATRHAHDERLHLKVSTIVYIAMGAISPFIYLSRNPYLTFALLAAVSFGYFSTFGPTVAAIQTLVPERMRATAFALLYLFVNLIGIGLGPLAVGALSDLLRSWAGNESLRYALLAMSPGYFWVSWHLAKASRTVIKDVEAAQSLSQPSALANMAT